MNRIIKASAGTGKTFALATHAIRLMLGDTPPRAIVALTFSRAAAGEIFNRIAERLARAAAGEENARRETADVMDGMPSVWAESVLRLWERRGGVTGGAQDRFLGRAVFARLLRDYVHSQHVSRIGTIDSFMAQMVRAFPVELGLQGAMTVMDDFEAARQRTIAADALLARQTDADQARGTVADFRLAVTGRESKTFCVSLDQFIATFHDAYLQHPQREKWGVPQTIWGAGGIPFPSGGSPADWADRIESQILAKLAPDDGRMGKGGWPAVVSFIRAFDGALGSMPTPLSNILNVWDGSEKDLVFNCSRIRTVLTGPDAKLMSDCLSALFHIALSLRCDRTQGIYRLMERIEALYARATRRRGLLTFSDIPRLIGQLNEITRLNIEYRFDSELRHWALDEFQDTSPGQWEAIRNLIDEAKSDGERTVFAVGDIKQAIYGWRGGTVDIFEHELSSNAYQIQELSTSYRYREEIAAFVNQVFGGETIERFLAESDACTAGENWRRQWMSHASAAGAGGYVAVSRVRKREAGDEKEWEPFIDPVVDELKRVRPWERGVTAALLVRTNDQGESFAEALRKAEIPAVWEGESDIADSPVVQAFLHLLRVVEHPDDTLAWRHVCAGPLLAAPLFAELPDGRTGGDLKEAVFRKVTTDVSHLGLARALRVYADAVKDTLDAFTRDRVDGLVRAASQFAAMSAPDTSLTDFADFVASFKTRAAADASVVKILTVHRSKGLGFDYVIVPIVDREAITVLGHNRIFSDPRRGWLLDQPPVKTIIDHDDVLKTADRETVNARVFEELCTYYVSMTRAKRALSVYLRTGGGRLNFSNHVERALGGESPFASGDASWYLKQEQRATGSERAAPAGGRRRLRIRIKRATPSALTHLGVSASTLFDVHETGAAARGTEIHETLSRLVWLDGGAEAADIVKALDAKGINLTRPSAFRQALVRTETAVELWRERNFEMFSDGVWTSGTFDRVVFTESAGRLGAAVYDFKSNRKRDGESDAAFELRMCETYASQMRAYRQALAAMTGLTDVSVTVSLLLTDTLSCVAVA